MGTPNERLTGQRALLRFLQRQGRLSAADVTRLEELARNESLSVQEIMEREGFMPEQELAALLAGSLRLRLIDLASFPLDPEVAKTVKESIATKYEVVPVRADEDTIEVATANPLDLEALKAVEFASGKRVLAAVATRIGIRDALGHYYRLQDSLDQFLKRVPDGEGIHVNELKDEGADLRTITRDSDLPPVVKLADLILIEGVKTAASDVHLEPGPDAISVRYRIDGILEEGFRFPKWVQNPLIGRFKVMAKLDIAERRVPQDGRLQVRHQSKVVDLRVSSLPTQHGEKITLRILDATRAVKALDKLGFSAVDLQRMREAGRRPQGMILVTGPTGSGKTTTLYALIREIFSPTINIVTVENPVEYQLKGISQVEINEKQGLNFAGVLRSVLRQDPDVILVGEIRDEETARIACQAAQTGHLVLSTVHTNDATATVTRMLDLGIEPFVLASSLNMIVAQRLVRRVCEACSEPVQPPPEALAMLKLPANEKLRRGMGCQTCRQSGFTGRLGVYEVVPVSPSIAKLIEANAGESAIRTAARSEGCSNVLDDAITKLRAGITTTEEVLRVVQVGETSGPKCPACQKTIAEDYSVCPHCSTVLRASCSACNKQLSPEWVTCPYCGKAQRAAPAQATPPLPVQAPAAPAPPPEVVAAATAPAPPPAAQRFHPRTYKALVVDDQPDLRHIVRVALETANLGLTVITAQDGTEALAFADLERPDVVILDVSMPGMDGFEVCKRLRADVRTAFVPILMLTAHNTSDFVAQGLGAGADDYVPKPFRRQDLVARVRRMLERTYGQDAVPAQPAAAAISGIAPGSGGVERLN